MRGYYRAVSNKQHPHHEWAAKIDVLREKQPMMWLIRMCYRNMDGFIKDLIYHKNPFFEMIDKTKDFVGRYVPVPIKFHEDEK